MSPETSREVSEREPTPIPARGARAHYEAELNAGRFVIQRCADCDRAVFYPRQTCPHCGSLGLDWFSPSGGGTVYSTTTVRLDPKAPHEVCLVDLDEGVRLMSTVRNLAPGAVRIGQRVQAAVEQPAAAPGRLVFDAVAFDAPRFDASGFDAPRFDAPAFDAGVPDAAGGPP